MGSSSSLSTKRVRLSGPKESRSNLSPAVQEARPLAKAKHRQSTEPQAATESDPSDDGDDAVEAEGPAEADKASEPQVPSFKQLGLDDSLCEACASLGYKQPTPIQVRAIPPLLAGSDLIGIAETGSGKSAAFALPTINALLAKPQPLFGLVLAPTRELAAQIGQTFEALGALINLRCAVIVGGLDMVQQAIALGRKPHIVVATPGRLVDHLEKTKGFSLRTLKVLVMDEADRLLDMDFGPAIEKLLKFIPRERHTMLFSATMSNKVESLQRASLRDPIRIAIRSDSKYQTVATLKQYYVFIPEVKKDLYLIYLANEFSGKTVMIFTRTVLECQRVSLLLRCLGFGAIPLHGQLSQASRLGALNKFKTRARDILVATDVAARGLDIPSVDLVLNYDLADSSKTHVHRIGRTARAGRSGIAINFATQYVLEIYQRIEAAMGQKLPEYPTEKEEVEAFRARVEEAQRHARNEMKALDESKRRRGGGIGGAKGKGKRSRDDMDAEEG